MASTERINRVRDRIKEAVSEIIQRKLKDPHVGFITITDVELTRDLQQAKVFYSVYGSNISKKSTNQTLRRARGFIQSELARVMRIRKVPTLTFEIDESLDHGLRIQELLEEIKSKDDGETGSA